MKTFFLRIAPALLLAIFILPVSVSAQALDLTVSPVSLDFSPRPGDVIKDKVMLRNNTGSPMILNLSVSTMTVDETGRVVPGEFVSGEATGWITFDSPSITAPSREWLDIPFTVSVPGDAAFGNYFALVFSPPAVQPGGGTAAVQGNVLVPILLNVRAEGVVTDAAISEFKVMDFVTQYLPVRFSLQVKNNGNVHVRPRGNLFIRGTGQKDLAVLEINPGQSSILPGATRTFTADWSDGFLVRDSNGRLQFNWNKLTDFRLGKYTAYVLLAYDDGQRDVPIDATLTFWVFPYAAVAIILVISIVFVLIVVYAFKALVKKEARKIRT